MNNLPLQLVRLLIVAVLLGSCAMLPLIARSEGDFTLLIFGLLALLAASIPLLIRKEFNLFEPITFVVLLVLTGVTLKLMYICAVGQDRAYIVKHLLLNKQPEVLMYGTVVVAVGLFCLSIGYCLRLPRLKMGWVYLPHLNDWHAKRMQIAIVSLFVFSLFFLGLFIVKAGVSLSSLESLSAKRFSAEAGDSAGRINKLVYYFYRFAALSKFVFYISLTWILLRKQPFMSGMGFVVIVSLLQSILLFFMISSRASVVLLLIDGVVIYYLMQDRVDIKKFVLAGGVCFGLLLVMLASRHTGHATTGDLVEKTFAGRDLMDISKTCHIINAVPERLEYRHGETLYGFLVAPIPRSMWPNKPMWAERGVFLMGHVFHDQHGRSGMPPGLIAEFYWNFGLAGVVSGMFFMGILYRQIFVVFAPFRRNPTSVIIFMVIVTRLTIFAIGNDFGTGFLKVGLDLVPLIGLLMFFGINVPREQEQDQEQLESQLPEIGNPVNAGIPAKKPRPTRRAPRPKRLPDPEEIQT